MPRPYRIKRYKHIYRNRRVSTVKAILAVTAVAAIIFIGVSLYRPVREFLSGKMLDRLRQPNDASSAAVSAPIPSSEPGAESAPLQEPSSSGAQPSPEWGQIRAVYIPIDVVLSGGAADYVASAGLEGANAAVVDCKGADGSVYYRSALDAVNNTNAARVDAYDLSGVARGLQDAGYLVIGRVCAFQDPVAARANRDVAVGYQGTSYIWLDNTEEAGGQPWLNPYRPLARDYIADIAEEAASLGVDAILLDGVQFPDGVGQELADFGPDAADTARGEALRTFVASVRERAAGQGCEVIPCVDAMDLLTPNDLRYGGENPARLFGGKVAVRAMPELFGARFEAGGIAVDNPAANPDAAIRSIFPVIRADLPDDVVLYPVLQGYTAEEYGKIYGAEEIAEQARALEGFSTGGYIVLYERQ